MTSDIKNLKLALDRLEDELVMAELDFDEMIQYLEEVSSSILPISRNIHAPVTLTAINFSTPWAGVDTVGVDTKVGDYVVGFTIVKEIHPSAASATSGKLVMSPTYTYDIKLLENGTRPSMRTVTLFWCAELPEDVLRELTVKLQSVVSKMRADRCSI